MQPKETQETQETQDTQDTQETKDSKSESEELTYNAQIEASVREVLIKTAQVPPALKAILPKDIGGLTNFLNSQEYEVLAKALSPKKEDSKPTEKQPASAPGESTKDLPKATKMSDISQAHLALFDQAWRS
jgi:hypothetical protein